MMYSITDLKNGIKFIYGDEPFVVLNYAQSKMGRGGSIVKLKIKNLINGLIIDKTFQGTENFQLADLKKLEAQYLYHDQTEAFFMNNQNFEQFTIPLTQIGDQTNYLKENSQIEVLYFQNKPINIELPIKMKFKVISAPPSIKGNSAGAVTKKVEIETKTYIDVPIFIKVDDIIVIDTREGKYVGRA